MKNFWIVLVIVIVLLVGFKMFKKNAPKTPEKKVMQLTLQKGDVPTAESTVKYTDGAEGYMSKPTDGKTYPGVIMVHDAWGLNETIKKYAGLLSSRGYNVLAVDLFNGAVTTDKTAASKNIGSLDQEKAIANMKAAVEYLKNEGKSSSVAVIGWGFGAEQGLKLSMSGEKLSATVIYYGNLFLDEKKLKAISWPILGMFGERDSEVSAASVKVFDKVLSKLGTTHELKVYQGAGHGFADPTYPEYSVNDTDSAWTLLLEFLGKNVKS